MDMYGMSTPEHVFRIDDLLDLSKEDDFFSTATDDSFNSTAITRDPLPALLTDISFSNSTPASISPSTQFLANDSFLPPQSDNAAELEWLSGFVDDSLFHTPSSSVAGNLVDRPDTSFSGEHRAKRSRPVSSTADGRLKETSVTAALGNAEGAARRCTHCASEETPQWRMGPLGPKTLCNACGVRYKSGRLVPEYRPAASPTFVLTQHSNSHRKVMELQRQKELLRQEQLSLQQQQYDFRMC